MITLDRDWLTTNNTDFEYKKYILLAYLQQIKERFEENEIYPYLSDLIEHYRSLMQLKENKDKLNKKELTHIDLHNLELVYTPISEDLLEELDEIVNYALAQMVPLIKEGRSIYDMLEQAIDFKTVGIVPKYMDEGFIILTEKNGNYLYSYKMSKILIENIKYRLVKTTYIPIEESTLVTPETIREKYILPLRDYNPITFSVFSKINIPIKTTLLPIIKRKILHYINTFSSILLFYFL